MDNQENNTTNPFCEEKAEETEAKEEEALENKEEELKKEIEDINNKYLRLAADFDNYRKRQMQERENLIKYGAEETLKKIIPVLDTFERAKKSVETMEEAHLVKESYEVCTKQLNEVLDKIGLKKIEAKGKEFDPNLMEAVMQTPTNEQPPHTVVAELQAGYQLYDRVLRPVMVNVAVESEE